ncbi:7-cyano-7-deazaguanine synthase QueC [Paenibacillus pasadenensis]|uniref:7-cyano-7-deazaguanine synthase QueC n=1 Tax=Paenibacillus pasadenensis TaxID=217090 RepID=UPI00203FAF9B|nr:7-cyano-7-deazaguanine synthase QueC [Paenibacillus pasadenensis]MCM3749626.1 7-cyano-7-deazaguanine synthase QueC [Paenibacillus pasadenensis]
MSDLSMGGSLDNRKGKAVVVFSGGQDSTTCLFWALQRFEEVETVTFRYGQRHALELECAASIAAELGVRHHELDMSLLGQLAPSSLTRADVAVADAPAEGGLPNSFVPGRNLLFLSFAAVLAKGVGAQTIVTGVCETDFSGYPDCRNVFIQSLNVSINLAMDNPFVIETPLMWLDKEQTWELADRLGAFEFVRERTLTCYNGIQADGCGDCPACKLRRSGLERYLARRGADAARAAFGTGGGQ